MVVFKPFVEFWKVVELFNLSDRRNLTLSLVLGHYKVCMVEGRRVLYNCVYFAWRRFQFFICCAFVRLLEREYICENVWLLLLDDASHFVINLLCIELFSILYLLVWQLTQRQMLLVQFWKAAWLSTRALEVILFRDFGDKTACTEFLLESCSLR